MKQLKLILLNVFVLVITYAVRAQSPGESNIYISKQSGESSTLTGNYSKTTDRFESGNVTINAGAPLLYTITPSDLSISTESSKTWDGELSADVDAGPEAGTSVTVTVTGDYDLNFSRPEGTGSEGSVTSTYDCGGGCSYHKTDPPASSGVHELVNATGQRTADVTVYSIKVEIDGKTAACKGDTLEYTASTYPSGGEVTWSTGETGSTIQIVAGNEDIEIYADFSIGGVSYRDEHTTEVGVPSGWVTGIGTPTIAGWSDQLNKVEGIKTKTKSAIKAIPAKIEIKGPDFSFSYKERDCCKDAVVTEDGESEVTGTVSGGIYASDVALAPPPWTASFTKQIQRYGYVFKVDLNYGLLLDVGGEFTGSLGYRANECVPEDCFTGEVGVNFPITLSIKASGTACITSAKAKSQKCKGTNINGSNCNRSTKNKCGYCSSYNGNGVPLHTSQSWWCIGCPSFNVTPASIASNIYGNASYNATSCEAGWDAKLGVGPVIFTASVGVFGYNLSWSHEIWSGAQLYP